MQHPRQQPALAGTPDPFKEISADTPVILDFDETLWLRNSTEMYLKCLWPRLPAVLILLLLDRLRPWRWLGGDEAVMVYRDWMRLVVTTILMPWNLLIWRYKALRLGPRYANQGLRTLLADAATAPFVATFGLRPIVRPLLQAIDPRLRLCVAGDFWSGFRLRRQGKWAAIQHALGDETARRSLYVTDSTQDQDVLDSVQYPVLIQWPDARYEDALARDYVPFLYSIRGKRSGRHYLTQVVIKRDVMVLVLAFAWTQPNPILTSLALLLLHLSFWLVYELGYHENDVIGERYEPKPTLASGYQAMRDRMRPRAAWSAALILALPGLVLLAWATRAPEASGISPDGFAMLALGWVGYLIASRQTFRFYNLRCPESRGLLYLLLQLFRSVGYAFFLPATLVGAALCITHVLVSWLPYLAYRYGGVRIATPDRLLYVLHFLLITLAIGLLSRDLDALLTWQSAAILMYFGWRARIETLEWLRSAERLVPRPKGPSCVGAKGARRAEDRPIDATAAAD